MPSSLTRDHSSALASSAYLPVSVCGTDTRFLPRGHFSSAQAPRTPGQVALPVVFVPRSTTPSFTPESPYILERSSSERCVYHSASPIGQTVACSTGMSTCSPSAHTFVFPLGPTNPPRITLAAEPLDFRRGWFAHPFSVTRSGIRTRIHSTLASADASLRIRRSPTIDFSIPCFGMMLCPVGLSAHRHSTSELLRTL